MGLCAWRCHSTYLYRDHELYYTSAVCWNAVETTLSDSSSHGWCDIASHGHLIKSPNGCFTVVECEESISHLLYFHPEHIDYPVSSFLGRGLSGTVGGPTLVGSIVLFGYAVWTIKPALAVTYTVLNLLYWIAAILPMRLSWHLDLDIRTLRITRHDTFIQCLRTTIYTTKHTDWAREHVPRTEV
jgi:hypothetical protein